MQIAYLINQYPKVSHTFVRREINELERLGIDVSRVSIRATGSDLIDDSDLDEASKTHSLLSNSLINIVFLTIKLFIFRPIRFFKVLLNAIKIGANSERGILIHIAYFIESCILFELVRKLKVEHIHAHFGTNSTTVAMFCKSLGGPQFSFTSHGPEEYDKTISISLSEKIAHASFVVGISFFGRSQLYRQTSFENWNKIKIVHCGLEATDIDRKISPVPDVKTLVCVGRLCEQKGQLLLVRAASQVINSGTPLKLVLVGDGEMRTEIETLIKRLRLDDHVEITGWASGEDVRRHIEQSRGFVLPSFAEGLPVVIMEAFAIGRPVISTYVAGIPELVVPGVSGWLCPASDVESLVLAIKEILTLPMKKLNEMAAEGKKRVSENHDIRIEAKVLADALKHSCRSQQKEL